MSDLIDRQVAIELIHSLYPSAPIMRMNRKRWKKKYEPYIEAEKALEMLPSAQPELVRCKDCRWGKKACGNIECWMDTNIPPEYHGYEWFCPNGERKGNG